MSKDTPIIISGEHCCGQLSKGTNSDLSSFQPELKNTFDVNYQRSQISEKKLCEVT